MITKEVASALSDDAKSQGKPVSNLANDLVKLYLKVREKGYDLDSILEAYDSMMFAKKTGHMLVSEEMYDLLVGKGLTGKTERLVPTVKESGRRMGRYTETMYRDPIDALRHLLPNLYWELAFEIRFEGSKGLLCITFPYQALGRARLVFSFVEGFLEACNYSLQHTEVLQGLIKAEFCKVGL